MEVSNINMVIKFIISIYMTIKIYIKITILIMTSTYFVNKVLSIYQFEDIFVNCVYRKTKLTLHICTRI